MLVIAILGGAAFLVLHLRGNSTAHGGTNGHVTVGSHSPRSGSPSASPSSSPAPASPGAVVTDYYTAINSQDYQTAYQLNELAQSKESYATFSKGFAGTKQDYLTITGVSGGKVSFDLNANQTDGSVKTYKGTYTVQNGKIIGAKVTQTN
jgi:hypothetical protein